MSPDLIDLIPDYEPDFGARGQVRFVPASDIDELEDAA